MTPNNQFDGSLYYSESEMQFVILRSFLWLLFAFVCIMLCAFFITGVIYLLIKCLDPNSAVFDNESRRLEISNPGCESEDNKIDDVDTSCHHHSVKKPKREHPVICKYGIVNRYSFVSDSRPLQELRFIEEFC